MPTLPVLVTLSGESVSATLTDASVSAALSGPLYNATLSATTGSEEGDSRLLLGTDLDALLINATDYLLVA